jgi:hypothetical protein
MSAPKKISWGETHEALKALWGLYWDSRCPDLTFGLDIIPKDNLVSLKIKANIEAVTRALAQSLEETRESVKAHEKTKEAMKELWPIQKSIRNDFY